MTRTHTISFHLAAFCPAALAIGLVALACFNAGCSSPKAVIKAPLPSPQIKMAQVDPAISGLSNEALIDRLQEESDQGVGTHATAWISGFLPLNSPGQFAGGVLGSPAPSKSQVMTELVRRGVSAMPALLDHLSDARLTKLSPGGSSGFAFMGVWLSNEYDYRFLEKNRQPAGVHSAGPGAAERDLTTNYTLKVGDLCYVAIGQIVNRRLEAVRYQPTACLVINSPIEFPSLAQAARAEWSALTEEQHERSLQNDLRSFSVSGRPTEAIQRLLFYYPGGGQKRVDILLKRRLFDVDAVDDFISSELVKASIDRQATLIVQFRQQHGEKYYACLRSVLEILATNASPRWEGERQQSAELLARFFADENDASNSVDQYVGYYEQNDLVRALVDFRWDGLDDAIFTIYRDTAKDSPWSVSGRIYRCNLALSCARRLIHQGHDEEFSAFFSSLIDQLKRDDEVALSNQGSSSSSDTGDHSTFRLKINQCEAFLRNLNLSKPTP